MKWDHRDLFDRKNVINSLLVKWNDVLSKVNNKFRLYDFRMTDEKDGERKEQFTPALYPAENLSSLEP